jgi:hypothetical protein
MDSNESKKLFNQVRIAHRLLAAYYQRLQHLMKEVSNHDEFGLEFYNWSPTRFCRPGRRSANQLNRWAWDLLPGVQTQYLFLHGEKRVQKPGDWLLAFHVISDTGVEHAESAENPLEIAMPPEDGDSLLRCYIVAPRKPLTVDWLHSIWDSIDFPECTDKPVAQCMDDEKQIYACSFEVPIEELTAEGSAQRLVTKVKEYRDTAIHSSVKSE